ncbi:hypothetical protein EVAR_9985_1 [Eumeta japonica]|uniref:Uncharacterized protein n=1 Tax=Eumeta variegata TaxID=151549 RepID=A0A4C1TQZ0_EUMVA|nr:hypothetical protein EVAR_9985_1 [Eumeta japonica]
MPEWKGRVPLTRSHCERITGIKIGSWTGEKLRAGTGIEVENGIGVKPSGEQELIQERLFSFEYLLPRVARYEGVGRRPRGWRGRPAGRAGRRARRRLATHYANNIL